MKCFICGSVNKEGAIYCKGCGINLKSKEKQNISPPNPVVLTPGRGNQKNSVQRSTKLENSEDIVDAGNQKKRKTKLESTESIIKAGDYKKRKTKLESNYDIQDAGQINKEIDIPKTKLVAFLVTYSVDPTGSHFPIREGRNIIGRDNECDIYLSDEDTLSGRHFEIFVRKGLVRCTDLGAQNSTLVDGKDIYRQTVTVDNGAKIKAGRIEFIFVQIP